MSFAGNCVYYTHVATAASRATSLNGMGLESSAQKQCNFLLLSVSVSVAFAIHSLDAKMEFTCSIWKRKIIRMVKRFTYISRSGIECLNSHMSGTVSCSPNATHFIIACSLCYALTLYCNIVQWRSTLGKNYNGFFLSFGSFLLCFFFSFFLWSSFFWVLNWSHKNMNATLVSHRTKVNPFTMVTRVIKMARRVEYR